MSAQDQRGVTRWRWLLKLTLWLPLLTLLMFGLSYALKDHLVAYVANHKIAPIAERLGLSVTFERAQLVNVEAVRLYGLHVGGAPVGGAPLSERSMNTPLLEVAMLEVQLTRHHLFDLHPKAKLVYVQEPRLTLRGDNARDALKRLQSELKRLKRRWELGAGPQKLTLATPYSPRSSAASPHKSEQDSEQDSLLKALSTLKGSLQKLPQVEVAFGELSGAQGELKVRDVRLQLTPHQAQASWRGEAPSTGLCRLSASLEGAKVSCERDVVVPVREDLSVIGRELSWVPQPTPTLYLMGLTAQLKGRLGERLPFSHLRADLTLGLNKDERGSRPINMTLRFPAGGAVQARGFFSREGGELTTHLDHFPASSITARSSGDVSADVTLSASLREGWLRMKGDVSAHEMTLQHEALAEDTIGPFNIGARGELSLDWSPEDRASWSLSLPHVDLSLGDIKGSVSLNLNHQTSLPHVQARFEMKRLNAQRFADSLPANLLPHLQPLTLKGPIAFKGDLDLNMADLKATKLNFKADLRRLKVLSHSEAINFDALKESFITEFTMPDGEVLIREVGPKNERWVPLNDVPPLLIQAIIAQEDGGFYKHKGISLFHLRGSLIRNLSEGRFARGGSTLTMQLARNLFLNKKKTLSRKLEELCLTWYLEQKLSKDELIELYVNVVEFGPNLFGIKEAAAHYFSKLPKELRPEEIVAITRLLPGPRLYAKFFERKRLTRAYTNRLNRLLKLLVQRGHLKEGTFRALTPTNLWEPYPERLASPPVSPAQEGNEGGEEGEDEESEGEDEDTLDPQMWGQPTYQAP